MGTVFGRPTALGLGSFFLFPYSGLCLGGRCFALHVHHSRSILVYVLYLVYFVRSVRICIYCAVHSFERDSALGSKGSSCCSCWRAGQAVGGVISSGSFVVFASCFVFLPVFGRPLWLFAAPPELRQRCGVFSFPMFRSRVCPVGRYLPSAGGAL